MTRVMPASMTCLASEAAARFEDKTAIHVLDTGERASFADIDDRASRYAGGLAGLGIERGDRVVLHLPNGIDWAIAYHAIARLGAVVVPANNLLTAHEIGFIALDSGAKAVILQSDRHEALQSVLSATETAVMLILHGEVTDDRSIFAQHLLESAGRRPVDARPDDLFTIGYTSGTTGHPKGAMQTHRALLLSIENTSLVHARTAADHVLSALPFSHVYGNIVLNSAFSVGLELNVMTRFEAGAALAAIDSEAITLFEGVPTMFHQMLSHPAMAEAHLATLNRCTVGGQTIPVATLDEIAKRFDCRVLELWGMTEVAGPATTHAPSWPVRHGSIGRPFPGLDVRIADLDDPARDAPDGTAGELCVRGPQVTRGYWANPEKTIEAIDSDGWLATGDVAVRDLDGYLRIVDRRKDLIITAGYNIYPAEIEQVIAMHPAVQMVAVSAIADPEKGELAKAFIVLRPDAACDEASLASHCRQHLAAYKVPRAFAFVDDLPKTSTGKILRRALRDTGIESARTA